MKKLLVVTMFAFVLGIAQMCYGAQLVDVPSGHWAEDAVKKLVDAGLVVGYPDGEFKGNRQLTRYEYAMVIERLVNMLDKTYCAKDECKVSGPGAQPGKDFDPTELNELKDIVKKLAAEFKDEIAALKVKVDENSARIDSLEKDVKASRIGNVTVAGSVRQRIDLPNSDLTSAAFATTYYNVMYAPLGSSRELEAGYEMVPKLNFTGTAGDNVTFAIGLEKSIRNSSLGYINAGNGTEDGDLVINNAYADLDFSQSVRELDMLKVRSGYQTYAFGPYGLLVDNSGIASNAAIKLDVAKDLVSVTGIAGLTSVNGSMSGSLLGDPVGLGSIGKDPYSAVRLGLDLPWLDLGVNYLADGVAAEKGWGADLVAPILTDSTFLKEIRAEYMTVSDDSNGADVPSTSDDNSFVIGLDVYKSKRSAFTLSYGDIPAAVALSSLDGSPFTEYDAICPAGLDVKPNITAAPGNCYSYENERTLFPAGFEGLGINASLIVFGDVEIAARGLIGNFAGDTGVGATAVGPAGDGGDYPGFGAVSVSKPINDKSTFRVEYAQQGKDPILLNRVRGELLITF